MNRDRLEIQWTRRVGEGRRAFLRLKNGGRILMSSSAYKGRSPAESYRSAKRAARNIQRRNPAMKVVDHIR